MWLVEAELRFFKLLCHNKPLGPGAAKAISTIVLGMNQPGLDLPNAIHVTELDVKAKLDELYDMEALQALIDESSPSESEPQTRSRSTGGRGRGRGRVTSGEPEPEPEPAPEPVTKNPKSVDLTGEDSDSNAGSALEQASDDGGADSEAGEEVDEGAGGVRVGATPRKRSLLAKATVTPTPKRSKTTASSTPKQPPARSTSRSARKRSAPETPAKRPSTESAAKKPLPETPTVKPAPETATPGPSGRPSTRRSARKLVEALLTPSGALTSGMEDSDVETPARRLTRRSSRRKG